jgi:hypothetical protein
MRRKASNTARGTLERRRTCGFFSGISAGLLDLAASRAPSDLFSARRIGRIARMQNASRERWRLAWNCHSCRIAPHQAFPLEGRKKSAANTLLRTVMGADCCISCSNMPLSQNQAQTGDMLHRATPSLGLARLERLRYHPSAIIDEDRKGQSGRQDTDGRSTSQSDGMSARRADWWGESSEKKCQ